MSISVKEAIVRGEKAIERPKGAMEITLFRGKTGITLRYRGKVICRTPPTEAGKLIAPYIAHALGLGLPSVGSSVEAVVSSGVLFRVFSIATLDARNEEARILLDYLLTEAGEMRGFESTEA